MLTHSDDKNFMCTECGYVTKWKHYLNVHMRKHTGDLRYCPRVPGLAALLCGFPKSCSRSCVGCQPPPYLAVAAACSVWHVVNAV